MCILEINYLIGYVDGRIAALFTRHFFDEFHQWGLIHEPFGFKSSDLTDCPEELVKKCLVNKAAMRPLT